MVYCPSMGIEAYSTKLAKTKNSVLNYVSPRKPEHPTFTPIGDYVPGEPLEHFAIHLSGHGAPQAPGMESPLRQIPLIDTLYERAKSTLGKDLSTLSESDLFRTENAQPTITLLNIASYLGHEYAFPGELQNDPEVISSQSLGMLSAAWFAGVFGERHSIDSIMLALELSQTRGEIMQKACDKPNPETGTMLVWAGDKRRKATSDELAILEQMRQETLPRSKDVSLALDISDSRIVLGGTKTDLSDFHKQAREQLKQFNINFYDLPTNSGAFHTKYMDSVTQEVRQMFENVKHLMQDPEIPLLSNSHKEPRLITSVDGFMDEMVRLCTEPVWGRDMARYLTDKGIDIGLEFGQRGIIAKSLDSDFFDTLPRKSVVAGTTLATGAVITTAIIIQRRKK